MLADQSGDYSRTNSCPGLRGRWPSLNGQPQRVTIATPARDNLEPRKVQQPKLHRYEGVDNLTFEAENR